MKCEYSKCRCQSQPLDDKNIVLVGKANKPYHKQCFIEKETIKQIKDYYKKEISDRTNFALLQMRLNELLYERNISVEYVYFALRYAVEHSVSIYSPSALLWIVDKSEIKKAYDNHILAQQKKCEITEEVNLEIEPTVKTRPFNVGFADILKRKKLGDNNE